MKFESRSPHIAVAPSTGARILCIDDYNDGRGVFVQAYLECLRLWQANCSPDRRWIFNDISSAGLYLTTDFSKNHRSLFHHELRRPKQEDRSNNSLHAFQQSKACDSFEKRCILARVGTREMRGINREDFGTKNMIICFDHGNMEILASLRDEAERETRESQKARIHYIPLGKGWEYDLDAFAWARKNVRQWATKYLRFREPAELIGNGSWRTMQVVINEYEWIALVKDHERRLRKIGERTKCAFHFVRNDYGKVVSVTGGRREIEVAARMIWESF
ncbi:uncharacterized protein EAF01_004840 [Botrytis porri]|uniref:Uncharacterized protein n=1 Tax=Botrytis porri TaxID=87229 RepID=A0A4Z1KYL6_9HELO|nr:uncharacterized protein EAF01_004840 [Botrytis porri]KAF7907253.1 hypothetical protein EAF01_004840 [Botrytis porri]TGO89556.1 hypothetical protein BPOR_0103g00020 [Botrytis porri]